MPPLRRSASSRPARTALVALAALVVLFAGACSASTSSGTTADVAGPSHFADGEQLRYAIFDDNNHILGIDVFTTRVDGDTYVLEQSYTESDVPTGQQPTTDVTRLTVRRDTLKPVSGTREIDQRTAGGRAHESYAWQYATDANGRPVLNTTHIKDGKSEQHTMRLREHYYDNESSLWLWRTLVLAESSQQQYVSVNPIENSQQTVDLRVPLRQAAEVPAGTFDTWRLLIRNGRAARTAWVNAAEPRQVVQWDNGTVLFKLMPAE